MLKVLPWITIAEINFRFKKSRTNREPRTFLRLLISGIRLFHVEFIVFTYGCFHPYCYPRRIS